MEENGNSNPVYKPGRSWSLHVLALVVGLTPILVITVTYLISAILSQVPWCVPPLQGCTSIGGATRQIPAIFVYRAINLPMALLLGVYWVLSLAWIRRQCSGTSHKPTTWLVAVGISGAVFLIVHTTVVGSDGAVYQLIRRFSIALFFGLTFLAQVIQLRWLLVMKRIGAIKPLWLPSALLWLAIVTLAAGFAALAVTETTERKEFNNMAEWIFAILIFLHIYLTARGWRDTAFRMSFGFPDRP